MRILVVWEPILATDWGSPSGSTLARISDNRARQFWDPSHEVSETLEKISRQTAAQPRPDSGRGFYWDEAIVFAPQARWENEPHPSLWKGPVYQIIPALEESLSRAVSRAGNRLVEILS